MNLKRFSTRSNGILLAFVIVFAVALALEVHISNTAIETTSYEVRSSRLPSSFDGFCIVQISDVHNHQFGPRQSELLALAREAHPDMIAITGDLVDSGRWQTYSPDLALGLSALAPAYFVTGNWEMPSYKPIPELLESLENSGVNVLRGRSALIHRGKDSIAVAGIDDPDAFGQEGASETEEIRPWSKMLSDVRENIRQGLFTVLLSHRPELISYYARAGFDVVLTGHAHGGQIRLPFIGALYAPNQRLLPRYTSGVHTVAATTMIVSRGLGSTHIHVRFLNRPEIVVVRLRKSD
ncbi:MAG TPA: metallophosphoesterase [Spirochaetia bacterium]|nr:metallophosphoesterase [Spirochaetia bacterium]